MRRVARALFATLLLAVSLMTGGAAAAQQEPDGFAQVQPVPEQQAPATTTTTTTTPPLVTPAEPEPVPDIGITVESENGAISNTVLIIILLTVGAVAPGILLLMTSFTRFIVVLALTRNAIGVQTIPPSQVLIGLAMFLTIFVDGAEDRTHRKDGEEHRQPD